MKYKIQKCKKGFIKQYKNTQTICKIKPTNQTTTDNTKYGKYKMQKVYNTSDTKYRNTKG